MPKNSAYTAIGLEVGGLYHIPNESQSTGENLGPFEAEMTKNGVLFLKSLNKTWDMARVGYMVIGDELHRYEAERDRVFDDFVGVGAGCYATDLRVTDVVPCDVTQRTIATRGLGKTYRAETSRIDNVGGKWMARFYKTDIEITEVYIKSEKPYQPQRPKPPTLEDSEPIEEREGEWIAI